MRKVLLSLVLATAGAIGLASPAPASADSGRIYVGIGDVHFTYGRPYWRHNNEPLYVVYERGYPRYYRYSRPYYAAPVYGYDYAPAYHRAPVYVRYDRYGRYDRYDRYDRRRHYDRHHDGRWDRDWDRDYRRGW